MADLMKIVMIPLQLPLVACGEIVGDSATRGEGAAEDEIIATARRGKNVVLT
jgi:hypothetical protein